MALPFNYLIFLLITIAPVLGQVTKIDPELKQKIDSAPTGSTWDILIEFKKDPNSLNAIEASLSAIQDPNAKAYQTVLRLEKAAEESQAKVIQGIKNWQPGKEVQLTTLWDNNDLAIHAAGKDLIYFLANESVPENSNVSRILEDVPIDIEETEVKVQIPLPTGRSGGTAQYQGLPEAWGLEKINAPAWWKKGYNGSGVIIGHIDSGVDSRHPSLKWNWVGKGPGWLDPLAPNNTFPWENDGISSHGTHTIGSIIGRGRGSSSSESGVDFFGVGVAPGARWISCLGCRKKNQAGRAQCLPTQVRECGAFLTCPGKDPLCIYRPDVVSVSIACAQTKRNKCRNAVNNPYYDPMIQLWRSVGIIPVYAAGNVGSLGCQTVANPADSEYVIGVGNIDRDDRLEPNSGLGPPEWRYNLSDINSRKIFKPDIVAPGTDVYSTVFTGRAGKFEYGYQTGTSQATPYVAGAIALLLSRTANMTFDIVKEILFNYTVPNDQLNTTRPNLQCGLKGDTDQPNHLFGWGRLRLPDPDELNKMNITEQRPTREMPPPPDYSDLDDNSTPPSVRAGMVGVVNAVVLILLNIALTESFM